MKDLDARLWPAIVAVAVWLLADAGTALSAALDITALGARNDPWNPSLLSMVDTFSMVIGVFYMLAFIGSAVFVGMWIYRANANAQTISSHVTVTPGWNIGFFFVPVASLFKPFEGLRQTWQASVSPDEPDAVPVPALMRWWWGLWLIAGILGQASFRLSMSGNSADRWCWRAGSTSCRSCWICPWRRCSSSSCGS